MSPEILENQAREQPLVRVVDLVKHFQSRTGTGRHRQGAVQAVDGVSFDIAEGETLGLVGESGSGKTTVARLIAGLEHPTHGRVLFRDRDLAEMSNKEAKAMRREVQMIFQDAYGSLDPRMRVADIVAEGWAVHAGLVPKSDRRPRVRELLELVGLRSDWDDRYPQEFSGGQQQRIGVARALALEPRVVICDEPVSSLDVSVQAQVINLLTRIQRDTGVAFLFISHDLSVVRHVADRVAVMYLGRVVEEGEASDVYERPSHPYTQALLSAVPTVAGRGSERIVLEGEIPSASAPPSGCRFRTRCWKAQEICAEVDPVLELRGLTHPSACHFAEPAERDANPS